MTERDYRRLIGCDLRLIQAVNRVLVRMAAEDFPMMVTDGVRTDSEQAAKWAIGRALVNGVWRVVGRVVTYAQGTPGQRSNHQSGRAADCCFVVDGKPSWAEDLPWKLYADTAIAEGLQAGYYWKRQDKPHIELPPDDKDEVLKV